jgi:hypothetical protein
MRTAVIVGVLGVILAVVGLAQTPSPPAVLTSADAVDVSHAEVQQFIKRGENNPMKSMDAGSHVAFVWYEHRKAGSGGGEGTMMHSNITEIYYVVHGSATLRTGGRLLSPIRSDIPGMLPGTKEIPRFPVPTFRGKAEGGVSRKLTVGDIVVMGPNTIHAWESIGPEGLGYLNLRIDPMKMLRGGYTHPLLVK